MEKYVAVVQLKYLKRRFLRSMCSCCDIFEYLNNLGFNLLRNGKISVHELDHFFGLTTSYINKKDILDRIDFMLECYYRWICRKDSTYFINIAPKLNAKMLLTCFVINYFPDFVLSRSRDDILSKKVGLDYDIYLVAELLVNVLCNFSKKVDVTVGIDGEIKIDIKNDGYDREISFERLVTTINKYSNVFNCFMEKDKIDRINELVQRWYELEKTQNEISKSVKYSIEQEKLVLDHLKLEQEKSIGFIRKIDAKFDVKILEQYKTFVDCFEMNMRKCYWDILVEDILKGNWDILLQSLNEIKFELVRLNGKFEKELDEFIDVDFLKQKLVNGVMHFDDYIALADKLIEYVIMFEARNRNEETLNRWNLLKNSALVDIHNCVDDNEYKKIYSMAVKDSIKYILDRIQLIKDDILGLRVLADLRD